MILRATMRNRRPDVAPTAPTSSPPATARALVTPLRQPPSHQRPALAAHRASRCVASTPRVVAAVALTSAIVPAIMLALAMPGALGAQGARVAGTPAKLGFVTQPPVTAFGGSAIRPGIQVALLDSAGTRVTSATDSVTLSLLSGPEGGTISGTFTVAAANGIATFESVSINLRGTYRLLATTQALGVASATSNPLNIVPGAAARLGFRVQPTNIARNGQFLRQLAVLVQDSGGNLVSGVTGWPVTISLGGGGAETVSGTLTRVTQGSQAIFNDLKFAALGEGLTLVAATSTPGIIPATSFPFAVREPGPARRLRVFAPPSGQVAGVAPASGNVVVAAFDSSGVWIPSPPAAAIGQIGLIVVGNRPRVLRLGTTPALASGRWTFAATFMQAGTYRLVATSSAGLRPDTSTAFTVNAGPAARLEVVSEPLNLGVEQPITPPIHVRIVDQGGAIAVNAMDTVFASLLPRPGTPGTLSGVTAVEAQGGIATFDNLKVSAAGEGYRIIFRSKAFVKDTTDFFGVTKVGAPVKLRLVGAPTAVVAGALLSPPPRVVAVDSNGVVNRTFSETVTLELTGGPPDGAIAGIKDVDAAEGVSSFTNVWVPKSGTAYRMIAKAPDMASDTSPAFDVATGPPAAFRFRTQPREYEYGAEMPGTIEVAVVDAGDNLVREATDSIVLSVDPYYPLRAAPARAVNGVATFSGLKVDGLPPRRTAALVASSATLPALARGTSQGFTSTPGKSTKLHIVSVPRLVNQGQMFDEPVRVEVRDAHDYPVVSDNSEVGIAVASNPGNSTLGGALRRRAVNGVATFDGLSLSRLGRDYSLVASSGTLTPDTSAAFTVVGPAYKLAFVEHPQDGLRNGQLGGLVQVQDSLGTPRNAGTVEVSLALGSTSNARAVLAGAITLVARAANNRATSPTEARLVGARITEEGGGFTLVASAPKLSAARSEPFTLRPHGLPHHLAFESPVPVSNPGGSIAPSIVVSVLDSIGNVVVSSADVVTLALDANAASATLNGTNTATALSGRATFAGLSLSAAGTGYTLAASSGAIAAAKSEPFAVVEASAPCKLGFTQQPTRVVAGAQIAVGVSVQRCNGEVVTTATDNITVSLGADPTGLRPELGGTKSEPATAGVATFGNLVLTRAAAGYTLVARTPGLTPATSQPFDATFGPAAKLVVIDPPGNFVAGSPMSGTIRVWVADAHGNRVLSATSGVTISLSCSVKSTSTTVGPVILGWQGTFNPPPGTCAAAKGPTNATLQGEAPFDLSKYKVRGASSEARFLFAAGVLTEAQSQPFTIAPGAPYTLGFEGAATNEGRRAKVAFDGIRVSVRDSIGNEVGQGNYLISLAVAQGATGKLEGAREQKAENGVATFNQLSISEGGAGVALVASAPGLVNGTSAVFAVASYGAPRRLFFKTSPASVAPDQKMPPIRIEVQDEVGNVVDTAHVRITLSIENNPGGGELRGQGPIETRNGFADFKDVRINRAGAGYSIRATADGFPEITSAPFDIGVQAPAVPAKPERDP